MSETSQGGTAEPRIKPEANPPGKVVAAQWVESEGQSPVSE